MTDELEEEDPRADRAMSWTCEIRGRTTRAQPKRFYKWLTKAKRTSLGWMPGKSSAGAPKVILTALVASRILGRGVGPNLSGSSYQFPNSRCDRHCQCAPKSDAQSSSAHWRPPAFAPTAPRTAKKNSDATDTPTIIGRRAGDSHAVISGNAAPAVKVAAEVIAA